MSVEPSFGLRLRDKLGAALAAEKTSIIRTTSSCNLSAIRSLSISSASKPISSTSSLRFSKYLSASLRRRSVPVSSSSFDSLLASSSSLGLSRLGPSSDPLLDIDSSRFNLEDLAFCALGFTLVLVARFLYSPAAVPSRLRFRWEAGAVKKEDIEKVYIFLGRFNISIQNILIVVCARNLGALA